MSETGSTYVAFALDSVYMFAFRCSQQLFSHHAYVLFVGIEANFAVLIIKIT